MKSQIIYYVFILVINKMDNGDDDCTYEQVGAQNKLKHAFPLKIINKWPRFGKKDEIDVVTKIENPYYL